MDDQIIGIAFEIEGEEKVRTFHSNSAYVYRSKKMAVRKIS
jgi:hypothetical protein